MIENLNKQPILNLSVLHVIGSSYVMYLIAGCSQEERGAGGAEGAEQGGPAAGRHGENAGRLQVVYWLQVLIFFIYTESRILSTTRIGSLAVTINGSIPNSQPCVNKKLKKYYDTASLSL